MKFNDKVVVVTGAARGLGREYARQFARRGARVAVSDLRDCGETLAVIEQEGTSGLATETDVTNAESAFEMARAVVEKFGRIGSRQTLSIRMQAARSIATNSTRLSA